MGKRKGLQSKKNPSTVYVVTSRGGSEKGNKNFFLAWDKRKVGENRTKGLKLGCRRVQKRSSGRTNIQNCVLRAKKGPPKHGTG